MTDVFISYSRKDTDFVRRLFNTLKTLGHEAWVDWQGIEYSTKWWEEICAGIERADNFVLVISPDALNSKYCHNEISHARKHNKRIIPFIYSDLDEEKWKHQPLDELALDNWEYLKKLQFISYPNLADFDKAVTALIMTVEKDPEHVRTHTELLSAALAWVNAGKSPGFLLRDERLAEVEGWLHQADAEHKDPSPSKDHRAFIDASRKAEDELKQKAIRDKQQLDALIVQRRSLELQTWQAADENERLTKRSRQFRLAAVVLAIVGLFAVLISIDAGNQFTIANEQLSTATFAQGLSIQAGQTSVAQVATAQIQLTDISLNVAAQDAFRIFSLGSNFSRTADFEFANTSYSQAFEILEQLKGDQDWDTFSRSELLEKNRIHLGLWFERRGFICAKLALQNGADDDDCVDYLKTAIAIDTDYAVDAYSDLVELKVAQGKCSEAKDYLQQSRITDNLYLRRLKGKIAYCSTDYREAVNLLDAWLSDDVFSLPNLPQFSAYKAESLLFASGSHKMLFDLFQIEDDQVIACSYWQQFQELMYEGVPLVSQVIFSQYTWQQIITNNKQLNCLD